MKIRVWVIVSGLVVGNACSDAVRGGAAEGDAPRIADGTEHPTPGNIPPRERLSALIGRNHRPTDPELARIGARLAGARLVRSIGAAEGGREEIFGLVEDVVAGPEGTFYVLDSRYNNIRTFDSLGVALAVSGRPGRGPDELMAPEAMARDEAGRLVVADRHNRVKLFAPAGAGFREEASISVRYAPEDFCLMNGMIFVQGASSAGGTVHAYDTRGDSVRSFAPPYDSPNWLVRNQLSDGPIACSSEAGMILLMYKYLPLVHGYSPDGELRWTSMLDDFRPIGMIEHLEPDGQPSLQYVPRDDGHDIGAVMRDIGGGYVLLQTYRHTARSLRERLEYESIHTYVISARTGEGLYVGSRVPRVAAVQGNTAYAAINEPYPQVRVLLLSEPGR